jgi:ubiquinone/menaquinone biosynthesis C-methylase UbiE
MRVDEYFSSNVPEWEAIYHRKTLYATIYQERLWTALRLVTELGLPRGSEVLDLGCGPGIGTSALAKIGFSVHAADSCAEMVERTVRRVESEGFRAQVKGSVADIHSLPFENAKFDLAFVIGLSEWLDELVAPLREVARVLKPGGYLVLSADNAWALSCFLDPLQHPMVVPIKRSCGAVLRWLWPQRKVLRTRAYSIHTLDASLRAAGFRKINGETLGFGPISIFKIGLFPDRWSHVFHRRISILARRRFSPLRHGGLVHLAVAEKR